MKHTITYRLIGYFSAALVLFSAIAGVLFCALFSWHTARIHERELSERALSIAGTLSRFSQNGRQGRGMSGGYGAYLRFIDEIAMSEVWLADEQARIIQPGHRNSSLSYNELPSGAEDLIGRVFEGSVASNREFSPLLDTPSITVGAPVYGADGHVTAALLLHSPINGIQNAQRGGILILVFCILIALPLAFLLSVLLARHFISPLTKIGRAAEHVMNGDYSARTGVEQADEIGSLARNIDELFLQLSQIEEERRRLDQMRQDFASNISHELRTPVTVLKGSLEVLEQGLVTNTGEIQEYVRQMLSDTAHLERLVNDLLELSRLQNANFQIEESEFDLIDVVTEAARSIQRIAAQKQTPVKREDTAGSFLFRGDYGRLRQMLLIILDNAVKFSPPGHPVTIRTYWKEQQFAISISDCGSGISPEDLPYIFDRFYRERSERNRTGTGLGLSIARQIADRHHITVTCESRAHDFTVFTFLFPQSASETSFPPSA
jgi:signal transduction histidine kinase